MCGLFGFAGLYLDPDTFVEIATLAGTRGPHAFGYAWREAGRNYVVKRPGRVDEYVEELRRDASELRSIPARLIIGHARLATSGSYQDLRETHPLNAGKTWIAHNGNVHNYDALIAQYEIEPQTRCDSEVIAHLIERFEGPLIERVARAVSLIDRRSPMALLVLRGNGIVAVRRGHPLYVYSKDGGTYLCSRRFRNAEPMEDGTALLFSVDGSVYMQRRLD